MSDTPPVEESVDFPPTPNIGEQVGTFNLAELWRVDLSGKAGEYQQLRLWVSTSGRRTFYVGTDNGAQHKRPFTYHTALSHLTVVSTVADFFRAVDAWHSRLAYAYPNKTMAVAAGKGQALNEWFK